MGTTAPLEHSSWRRLFSFVRRHFFLIFYLYFACCIMELELLHSLLLGNGFYWEHRTLAIPAGRDPFSQ